MECIILAGGLGTRLQGVIGAQPKCMAEVNGRPFLAYLFEYLDRQRCTRAILSLGYKHREVTEWLEDQDLPFELDYVVETEPLGTGGGIQAAIEEAASEHVAVINGDTLFLVDLAEMMRTHLAKNAETTVALKAMRDFDRYGTVRIDGQGAIQSFEEKKPAAEGLINGGVYVVDREALLRRKLPGKFSFERDYLERFCKEQRFFGYASDGYFIDIGVPDDYERAHTEFKTIFS